MREIALGVNVDHIATLRQARGTDYPDPVRAALAAEAVGADGITVHLREDRRHIQDHDVRMLREVLAIKLNLEMASTAEMIAIACELAPPDVCLVPERRAELTTEGGLDVVAELERYRDAVARLAAAGIRVSFQLGIITAHLHGRPLPSLDVARAMTTRANEPCGALRGV